MAIHPAIEHHRKAAEHHRKAAAHHEKAAECFEKGEYDKAAHHAHLAHSYYTHATHYMNEAARQQADHSSALKA